MTEETAIESAEGATTETAVAEDVAPAPASADAPSFDERAVTVPKSGDAVVVPVVEGDVATSPAAVGELVCVCVCVTVS